MSKFDGFIFDVDGTLTNTNKLIFESFRFVTQKYLGESFSDSEITKLFGPTEDVILKDFMGENYASARDDYFKFYSENHNSLALLHNDIAEILQSIKSSGFPISIYTGKGRDSAMITLEEFEIKQYFDMIVTGDDIKDHKPSREGIDLFVENFELNPDRVLMIGDAIADIKAARNAGVRVASVLYDCYAKNEVLGMEADYYLETTGALKDFILDSLN
ncbi:MAG: HAD-IA family hydrolase [Melioribacteraceae bacterium]|nr:HAD-IA family hydrolase [Melioribacteraceae bacterium]MCF8264113.1 HAD-IA family hydrolase [Melioribacteraceae bacterium]MCF8431480.1 HAD-IA family hydrolase [Melioribacteraceae bacterium]